MNGEPDLAKNTAFQRLRRIRQLGFSDLVFPGATRSRFAHSIGVYHMARRLADIIASRKGHEHDADRERVALLAALLHDVGHGPFQPRVRIGWPGSWASTETRGMNRRDCSRKN